MNTVRRHLQTVMPLATIAGLALLYVLMSSQSSAMAQESSGEIVGNPPAALPDLPIENTPATEDEREQRQKSAMAGLLILWLVCLVFLVLIVVVILWARRMRRMVNQPLPEQHRGDPLWYLRKSDASVSENEDQV